MSWKGKLIGLLLGLLTRRPQLMVLGLLIGHLYDIGFFRPRSAPPPPPTIDPYAVLDVPASASDEDIEQAYRRRISDYHPDRVSKAAPEIRELAEKRAREINGAYEEIKRRRGL